MEHVRVAECGRDVGRMVQQTLEHASCDESSFASLTAALERRIAVELEAGRAAEARPACGPGCSACCTVNVATLPVEGAAVAAFLRRRLAPDEIAPLAASLLAFHDRIRWCEDSERIRDRLACPFLDAQGECLVHPVRPLACRAVTSLDAGECRRALDEIAEGEGDGCVRMGLLQRALYDEARRGVAAALSARGLDARVRDVSGMAGVFLADASRVHAYVSGTPLPLV